MLGWITDRVIESKVKAACSGSSKSFVEWSEVKKICLLITRNEFYNESSLEQFIKTLGKETNTLVFVPGVEAIQGNHTTYNKKQLNFLSLPRQGVPGQTAIAVYDLLIDCNFREYPSTKLLSGSIKAKFKVGLKGLKYDNYFDICIDMKQDQTLDNYLKQVLNYLKMIKTKN